jgi:hypothetical protein
MVRTSSHMKHKAGRMHETGALDAYFRSLFLQPLSGP